MKFQLKKTFQIESARSLPKLPSSHPCSRVHGHSFKITLLLVGNLDPQLGWLIDYNDIHKSAWPTIQKIDHCLLNNVEGLENPTTEILTAWLYNKIKKELPDLKQVIVNETSDTECAYPATWE